MDERLEAGRLHLTNGEQAVQQGYPDDARMYFEAALLQFRGPELRLGEAHAMRGLAQVATVNGDPGEAERFARSAVRGYRELFTQLERIDPDGVSNSMKTQSRMGEAASLVLLGEILVRRGARDDARTALSHARVLGATLGHFDAVAGVWNMLARLAMRDGRYDEARDSMDRALSTYRENRSVDGEVGTLLLIAEVERLRGDFAAATEALNTAGPLAARSRNPMYEGRVLAALGALALQTQDLESAESYYDLSLPLVRSSGDHEMEGYSLLGLGEVASRLGRADALEQLIAGARVLAELDHRHGLGGAMLRISEHALRLNAPELALAASECARRCFTKTDPVRGVGQSGRLLVKALAAMEAWRAVLLVSAWRVDVLGPDHETASAVLAFYRERAPHSWWDRIGPMDNETRSRAAVQAITRALSTVLDRMGAPPDVWEDSPAAVNAIEALAHEVPVDPEADLEEDDDTEVHARSELRAANRLTDSNDAVLVFDENATCDEGGMVWNRGPSELDRARTRKTGTDTPHPVDAPADVEDLDRYLVESSAPVTLASTDDKLFTVEEPTAQPRTDS